ncbi:MAG TPA: DNA topoisomerase IB [Mesorhizobium sp.]|uniref:DNA topoisomerase IB n=1 Tax=Mesorhizobium sp. TaxID=1871066 RepID=UPI002DDC9C1E|nr:DNA topoisomerase IB [Mesorhizobium sp.]HEV2503767.1 DNA topoisomerase IB [Mesorhizobium sp.]
MDKRSVTEQALRDGAEAARAMALRYVADAEPGIFRRRVGRGFRYEDANGGKIVRQSDQDRIRLLAIPPAWTQVWICGDDRGHIQATGRDLRGRRQYLYHPDWLTMRGEAKFSSLVPFARALPAVRAQVDSDLRRHGLPRERVLAVVIWLLDNTLIRIGNPAYARENGSFGLTTLRDKHVEIIGSTLRFMFKGKSGKEWKLKLADRRIAGIVRHTQELPGQTLFQYLDENGDRASVTSNAVNAYIGDICGFSSKHFRTWGATVQALALFAQTPLPGTKKESSETRNRLIDKVAASLGNTRAVCRSGYIHPQIIASWEHGQLPGELRAAGPLRRKEFLDADEVRALAWLKLLQAPG